MHASPFEIGMLICFGAGWPMSVIKTWQSKTSVGRSFGFLWVVFIGYVSGIMHKLFYQFDYVILLYSLNAILVAADLALCYYYRFRPGGAAAARVGAVGESD